MVRPLRYRIIRHRFRRRCFRSHEIARESSEVILSMDEAEALRLKNLEDLDQIECAKKMNISQSTFQRILQGCYKKIAEAITYDKIIRVKGGKIKYISMQKKRKFKCEKCKHVWEKEFGTGKMGVEMKCPECDSELVHRIDQKGHGFGRKPWGYKKS